MKKTLIYDVSNILFRVAAVQKHSPNARDFKGDDLVGLCMHISLMSIYRWFNKFRPDFVIFAFEGGNLWRREYTDKRASRRAYKGNRVQDPEMKHFYELIDSFYTAININTSICCLKVPRFEADDVIAAYTQLNAANEEIYIISGDRDFVQLLSLPNVKLVNPDDGKLRNQPGSKHYEPDIAYWLFLKCIRGDMGDNVPAAYPRVRETKVKQAYQDVYALNNMMNETWKDETDKVHRVGDLFEENVILLDLAKQPEPYRTQLVTEVQRQSREFGKYNHFMFLRFLNEYQLKRIQEEASRFIDLFNCNRQTRAQGELPLTTEAPSAPSQPTEKKPLLGF